MDVVHTGEAISGLFKKKEYIVLTHNELRRFKSRSLTRTPSMGDNTIPLNQLIAFCDSGTQIELYSHVSNSRLHLPTRNECEVWLTKLQSVAPKHTTLDSATVDTARKWLISHKDFHAPSFRVFRVITRSPDTPAFLAVGHYSVYVLGTDMRLIASYGIVSLVHVAMSPRDSTFYLSFRIPFSPIKSLHLASCAAKDVVQHLRACLEFLRPCWSEYPLVMDVPEYVSDEPLAKISGGTMMKSFDTTLSAYCVAFGVPNNVAYTTVPDDMGLVFHLTPGQYKPLTLIALFRSLRWNETFSGISLAHSSLDALINTFDGYAAIELDQTRTANNRRISKFVKSLPILKLELQLIMLCSSTLRMLNIDSCVRTRDRPSGIIDALMQVAKRATSNVDSFVFSNIQIDPSDLDYLIDVASTRAAHLRNLEIANCGLYERELSLLLQSLEVHENTLEGLDISSNPGRISVHALNESLYRFALMRNLVMRSLLTQSEDLPLLSFETLSNMSLKKLVLDSTRLSPLSVSHLSRYLARSTLAHLSLQSCALTGTSIASLLSAITNPDLAIDFGDNPVCRGFDDFLSALSETKVKKIAMPRIEFDTDRLLCKFLRVLINCTITHLDLSFLLIPDADASIQACQLLGEVIAQNTSLKSLNLTGETSKLQVARIGHGITHAIERLQENSTLQFLDIQGNELLPDGAFVLAQQLRRNRSLKEIHIDDNKLNLAAFASIVEAVVESHSSVKVAVPERDRQRSIMSGESVQEWEKVCIRLNERQ